MDCSWNKSDKFPNRKGMHHEARMLDPEYVDEQRRQKYGSGLGFFRYLYAAPDGEDGLIKALTVSYDAGRFGAAFGVIQAANFYFNNDVAAAPIKMTPSMYAYKAVRHIPTYAFAGFLFTTGVTFSGKWNGGDHFINHGVGAALASLVLRVHYPPYTTTVLGFFAVVAAMSYKHARMNGIKMMPDDIKSDECKPYDGLWYSDNRYLKAEVPSEPFEWGVLER